MDKYNVGILGATGAVGREMLKILRERSFPVGELRLLASRRSAGSQIGGHEVVEACAENFKGLDIVLGAAENNIAAAFAGDIKCFQALSRCAARRAGDKPRGYKKALGHHRKPQLHDHHHLHGDKCAAPPEPH